MRKIINVVCKTCNKQFIKTSSRYNEAVKKGWDFFCSKTCLSNYRIKYKKVFCDSCNAEFIKNNAQIEKTKHNFCSKSCAAKYNNKNRIQSEKTREKIANKLKGRKLTQKQKDSLKANKMVSGTYYNRKFTKINIRECKICHKLFCTRLSDSRKTCSTSCRIIASTKIRTYQNGSRKTTWYVNPFDNKEVLLESSWEVLVADKLCSRNIIWIRPSPLSWVDKFGKQHLYFPDFYLPKQNLYLDPKNPYCMRLDRDKLSYFRNRINLIFGDVKLIMDHIDNL